MERAHGVTALGVGDGVMASLPVMSAGSGMRKIVLGPSGAHEVGGSGFGRSGGVDSEGSSSEE
jgi:hypothetical protein